MQKYQARHRHIVGRHILKFVDECHVGEQPGEEGGELRGDGHDWRPLQLWKKR